MGFRDVSSAHPVFTDVVSNVSRVFIEEFHWERTHQDFSDAYSSTSVEDRGIDEGHCAEFLETL